MRAFILAAHGSRKEDSNREISRLAEELNDTLKDDFDLVDYAFMEKAEPSLKSKLTEITEKGADEIVVLPYLLARGFHVATDIPEIIEEFKAAKPGLAIRLTDHIGASPDMPGLIKKHVTGA